MATIRQLEYFVALVEEGSFTRAADRLLVSQPGLSHQFRALETEVGSPLVERLPRGLRLTPAGRAALPHARATLAHSRWTADAARRSGEHATGAIEVATLFSLSAGFLPPHLAALRARFPDVSIRLFEFRHTEELREAMAAGRADVAIGPRPSGWDGPVHGIGAEEFVVVGAADSVIDDVDTVRLDDLREERWISFTPESGLSGMIDAAMDRVGITPRVVLRTEQAFSAIAYARTGLGLTIAPRNVVPGDGGVRIASLDPPLRRDLAVYTRSSVDPVARFLIDSFGAHILD